MTDLALRASAPARSQILPPLLAVVAGLVDVTTFTLLGGVFSAHVTGNFVVAAADVAHQRPFSAVGTISIGLFAAVAAFLAATTGRAGPVSRTRMTRLAGLQCVLIVMAGAVAVSTGARANTPSAAVVVLLAVAAMAVQNTVLHLTSGRPPATAVMTGNLVAASVAVVEMMRRGSSAPAARGTWRSTWPLLVGFLLGCVFGSVACGVTGAWAWSLPSVLSGAVIVIIRHRGQDREVTTQVGARRQR